MGEYLAGDQIGNIVTGDNFSAENHFVAGMSGLGQGFVAGAIPLSGLSVTGQAVSQIGNASVWGGQYTLMTNGNASGFITSGMGASLKIHCFTRPVARMCIWKFRPV